MRVVAITGAAGGIGRAVAEKFMDNKERYFVIRIDSSYPEIKTTDLRPKFWLNVSNPIFAKQVFHEIHANYGGPSILVNAAGILPPPSPVVKTDLETIRKVIDVNLLGTLNCCMAVLSMMRVQKYGRIVNISSVAGQRGDPGNAIYAASKAAVESLTKSLVLEAVYCKEGETPPDITVNAVAPGIVDTSMTANLPEKAFQEYLKRNPLKRKIKSEEVAEAVYFLATASQAINGVILPVDGGYLAS